MSCGPFCRTWFEAHDPGRHGANTRAEDDVAAAALEAEQVCGWRHCGQFTWTDLFELDARRQVEAADGHVLGAQFAQFVRLLELAGWRVRPRRSQCHYDQPRRHRTHLNLGLSVQWLLGHGPAGSSQSQIVSSADSPDIQVSRIHHSTAKRLAQWLKLATRPAVESLTMNGLHWSRLALHLQVNGRKSPIMNCAHTNETAKLFICSTREPLMADDPSSKVDLKFLVSTCISDGAILEFGLIPHLFGTDRSCYRKM